jgi:hypothetical protein
MREDDEKLVKQGKGYFRGVLEKIVLPMFYLYVLPLPW